MERRSKTDPPLEDIGSYTFPVGQVVGFQALAGEVKIRPSTNNPELLSELTGVRVSYAKGMAPPESPPLLAVSSVRIDRKMLLIKFERFEDRTAAEHLEGASLFAKESELLPLKEEEFWVSDLVGMAAYTTEGQLIGTICSIIPSSTDLLEIRPADNTSDKMILVPFITSLVPVVDMAKQRVEVVALPGLLEPQ